MKCKLGNPEILLLEASPNHRQEEHKMTRMQSYVRRMLVFLLKSLVILAFKIIGPPRILHFGRLINKALLKAFGAKIGENSIIHSPIVLHRSENGYANLIIGDHCLINSNIFLDLTSRIILENGVSLGPGVTIMTHNRYNFNAFLEKHLAHTCGKKDVVIKEGAGIKAGALIIHGITIGRNAVVGGNAVVNRDVPGNCFVAGVPARLIKEIK